MVILETHHMSSTFVGVMMIATLKFISQANGSQRALINVMKPLRKIQIAQWNLHICFRMHEGLVHEHLMC